MSGKPTETVTKPQDRLANPVIQPQLARVKREEDEEDSQDLWISGEELYTDGSSDEEDSRAQWRSRRKINSHSTRPSSSTSSTDRRGRSPIHVKGSSKNVHNVTNNRSIENVTDLLKTLKDDKRDSSSTGSTYTMTCSTDKTGGTCSKSKAQVNVKDNSCRDMSNENEQQRKGEISWKAKRGTIKLPNVNADAKVEVENC